MKIYPDLHNGIERIRNMDICLARKFLQEREFFEPVVEKVHQVARDKARCRIEWPLEKIHEHISAEQIKLLCTNLARERGPKSLRVMLAKFTHDVVREELGVSEKFWLDFQPVVRFYTPHDFWVSHKDQLNLGGHLRIQGPHHDTWFGHATEGMNLWMAIGPVCRGNGLSVYPDACVNGYIEHDGNHGMPKDQYIGVPVNFNMSPGDMLLFHGEMVHASELNQTQDTRFVLTTRFSLDPPIFQKGAHGGNSPWITSEEV
jgi:hypothetical protein